MENNVLNDMITRVVAMAAPGLLLLLLLLLRLLYLIGWHLI